MTAIRLADATDQDLPTVGDLVTIDHGFTVEVETIREQTDGTLAVSGPGIGNTGHPTGLDHDFVMHDNTVFESH